MAQFTKLIQVDNVKLEFWFTKTTYNKRNFFVTVENRINKFYSFHMEVEEGKWKIVEKDKVPSWILELEEELSNVIIKNTPIEDRGRGKV